jgi:NADH-ubiquinone oxidoreductase chain 5
MVVAAGLSEYSLSLFHLINHAFFKALLFLSAGAIIHAVMDEQDFRRMGGLIYFLPKTYTMILVGSLSLMALPFFTGFYSKDLILEVAWSSSFTIAYLACLFAALFTTIYSIRLII